MKSNYEDIYMAASEGKLLEPVWFDENGCPRFAVFTPELCPDIYAQEVILLEIACQDCHKKFLVQMSNWAWKRVECSFARRMSQYVKDKKLGVWSPLHYGDPPNHGCIGDTMNCYDLRVVEFWDKSWERDNTWLRHPEFEVQLMKEEDYEDDKGDELDYRASENEG